MPAGILSGEKIREDAGRLLDGLGKIVVEADPNVDVRKPMFFALAKAGYPILMLKPLDMSLEDIFLKLTTEEN